MELQTLTYNPAKSTNIIRSKKSKPKPTLIFKTYWKFAAERQNIFFKRFEGELFPWTNDPILSIHKFTNVYRASDRVSQYLIKKIIYEGSNDPNELFFRIILFKTFNRISTWEYLIDQLGQVSYKKFNFKIYDKLLTKRISETSIYSGAYIMTSGRSIYGFPKKHQNHLQLIGQMMREKLPERLQKCKSMSQAYDLLLSYPTIGEFLAYQYVTDLNYSPLTNFSEMEFVKAGPGAKDGISKCFSDFGDYSYEDIIKMMAETQSEEFSKLNLNFKTLWGRPLQLIDCQNIFCEVDKYSRVAHPNISGNSTRTRIKQKFKLESKENIKFCFPPKWNLKVK